MENLKISPALTPIIASLIGWENALYMAAILAITGALLWLGIRKPELNEVKL